MRTVESVLSQIHFFSGIKNSFRKNRQYTELKLSEIRFRSIFENANDAIFLMQDGKFIDCNSKTLEIFGYNKDQIIDKTPYDLSPEFQTDGSSSKEKSLYYLNLALQGFPKRFEWKHSYVDGSVFDAEVSLNKLEIDNKALVQAVVRDIRDRKLREAEQALIQDSQFSRTLINLSPAFFCAVGLNGKTVMMNPSLLKALNYMSDEVVGTDFLKTFIPVEDQEELAETFNQLIKDLKQATHVSRILTKEGSVLDVEWHIAYILKDTEVDCIFGVGIDITEKRKAEKKLRESEERIQRIINAATEGISVINQNMVITFVNDQMTKMLGYDHEELLGKSIENFIHEDDKDNLGVFFEKRRRGISDKYERRFCKKDGSILWTITSAAPIMDSNNEFQGSLSLLTDITEHKFAERKMLNAIIEAEERERNYFARELHDGIGPILSTIKLHTQCLKKSQLITPREEILAHVENAINEAISTEREISNKLSPQALINFGLVHALKLFINKVKGIVATEISFETNVEQRFCNDIEITVYRMIVECMNNTIKHANAKNIKINIMHDGSKLIINYVDDGIGFNYGEMLKASKGFGLFTLKNRIDTLGGKFLVDSESNKGFKLKATINL